MTIAAGYDELDGDTIKATYNLHQIDPNSKTPIMRLTSEALTSKGARVAANRKSHKKLVSGQLRVVIFNEKLARKACYRSWIRCFARVRLEHIVYGGE